MKRLSHHFRHMGKLMALAPVVALTACMGDNTGIAVETKVERVDVAVRAPCPDDATYAKTAATRPVPLREQPRPATEDAIHAAEHAQLGRYEAPGQWADQAQAVIDSCHSRQELPSAGGG